MESVIREEIMDLDLNQEPLEPPHGSMLGLGTLLNDIEIAHGRIEERIQQLEEVTSRARQRQRWRQAQTPPQTSNENVAAESHSEASSIDFQERTVENNKSCKRDRSHLIAKALGMDTDVKKVGSDGEGFFDCNICLDMARDPILTCCGHLFCWPCFYQLQYVQSDAKECPVCKGEVRDSNITPIYGNGSKAYKYEAEESGLMVPPRPQAHRIDSARQQRISRGLSTFPIEEAIRRITNRVGAMGERTRQQDLGSTRITSGRTHVMASQVPTSQILSSSEAEGGRRLRVLQFSRLLSQEAASLSSLSSTLSSALSSAERIVEDLEALFHSQQPLRRSRVQAQPADDRDSFMGIGGVIHLDSQTLDTAAEINATMPLSSVLSRVRTDVSSTIVDVENEITDTAIDINLAVPLSSSSSRGADVSNVTDVDNGVSRESRRRRLR